MKRICYLSLWIVVVGVLTEAVRVEAANITLIGSDSVGSSSFDGSGATNWSNGQIPSTGNAYFTGANALRTPAVSGSYTFAGDSLSLDSGGNMNLKTSPGILTFANLIMNGGRINNGFGSVTIAGNINVTSNSTFETQGRSTTVAAPISGASNIFETCLTGGAGTLGTVILSASNSFSGQWIINDANNTTGHIAVLNLANANALQNSIFSLITTNNNLLLFSPGIGAFTLGGLSGTGNFGLTNTSGGAITLQVGYNNASTNFPGAMGGAGILAKIGSGTLTLFGTNTYSGGTIVGDGTLWVNNSAGSGTGAGAVNVTSNATLGGIGMITGAVNVAGGGVLSPGTNGVGILTVGAVTLNNNATFVVQLGGTNEVDYNQLVISSGSISLDNSVPSLSLTNGFKPVPGDSFMVLRNVPGNPVTGRFTCGTNLRLPGFPGSFIVNYAGGAGNDVVLQYQAEGTVITIK